ncbi:MAG: CorA family divalent cation transporter [Thermoplasmata archaeon]|nr:CorA family divalent cation transporter [Thermoplasmata archaeon]
MPANGQNNTCAATTMEHDGLFVGVNAEGKTTRCSSSNAPDFLPEIEKCTISWVNFRVDDIENEGLKIATIFGFSSNLYNTLIKEGLSGYFDIDTELGIKLPAVLVERERVQTLPIIIMIRKGLILTIHTEKVIRFFRFGRYADIFFKKIPKNIPIEDKNTIIIARLIDENNTRNFEYLSKIEAEADEINDLMADATTPGIEIAKGIHKVKKMIIQYMNVLWASLDVVHSLRYGDADLISDNPKLLARVTLLAEDLNRQIGITEHMSEVLTSGLEVVQTLYNNQLQQLNNRITWIAAWLAILSTAAIVPNTIATILGSPVWGLDPANPWHVFIYLCLITFPTVWATFFVYTWVKQFAKLPSKREEAEVRR